jgi:ribosome maturation protein SDO1
LVVSIDKAVVARFTQGNLRFEILVDPERALEFRLGKPLNLEEILAYPAIYKDARKTDVASEKDIQKVFGTSDIYKVAEKIIKQGEIQLTTEQKRKIIEQKKLQIATIISERAVNPQTNMPHPPQRILNAMQQAGVNIDPMADVEAQVEKVLKGLKPILPIKFQKVILQLKLPSQFAGRCYTILKNMGSIKQEQWLADGSLQVQVEIFAGVQDDLFKKIADITHGQFESKIVQRLDV